MINTTFTTTTTECYDVQVIWMSYDNVISFIYVLCYLDNKYIIEELYNSRLSSSLSWGVNFFITEVSWQSWVKTEPVESRPENGKTR